MTQDHDKIAGHVISDTIVAACEPWSAEISKGEVLRMVDLEGQQAVDFLCYDLGDKRNRYNAANTIKLNNNIYLGEGTVLYSVRAQPLMTIIADSCGSHDTVYGCCSIEIDRVRFNKENSWGCQQNFEKELAKHGMSDQDIVANINFFMYVPVAECGQIAIADGKSKPGDHVDLRAERDVLAVISNCPERDNAAAGYKPTPIRTIVYRPEG